MRIIKSSLQLITNSLSQHIQLYYNSLNHRKINNFYKVKFGMKDSQQTTIYLRYGNGKGKRVKVLKRISKSLLYNEIKKSIHTDNPQLEFELYLKGKVFSVQNPQKTDSFKLQENSIFHVKKISDKNVNEQKIVIKVKIKNQQFKEFYLVDSMVKQLKNDIANDCNMKPQFIYLSHLGKKMNDLSTLRQCGITEDTWLSAEYFAEKSKLNQEINITNAKLSQSVQFKAQNEDIQNSYRRSQSGGNHLQIGVFNNLFTSAISQSVQLDYEDQVYDFERRKQLWVGQCYVEVKDLGQQKQFTVNCQSSFPLGKLVQMIAKIEKVRPEKIALKNPQSRQKFIHEERTVANFPWQGIICHGILLMKVSYEVS